MDVVVFVVVLVMVELSEAVKTFAVWAFEGKQCLSVEQRERYWSVWHWCTCLCHGCFREVTEFLHRSHGEVREGSRGTFPACGREGCLRLRGAGIRSVPLALVVGAPWSLVQGQALLVFGSGSSASGSSSSMVLWHRSWTR